MARKVEEEGASWTKAITGLNITKYGLIISINRTLKTFLNSFSPEQLDHLSEFLDNTQNSNVEFKIEKGKKTWKISPNCCKSGLCQTILDLLWEKHENKSKRVVWSPRGDTSNLFILNKKRTTSPYAYFYNKKCSICEELYCPFERIRRGMPLFDDTQQNETVNKYYWQIANMYMFRGKETNKFPNTGPEDTDPSLIFKLMKNCKLFSLDNENDIDNGIYDDLLEVRNLLMHSPDNCLSDEALEECFKRMESILKASMFANEYSEKAISELEKLKSISFTMNTLTPQHKAIVKEAFNLQQSSVEFDMNVSGSLKNDNVLQSILKASADNREKYTGNAEQTPAPPSQSPVLSRPRYTGTRSGAAFRRRAYPKINLGSMFTWIYPGIFDFDDSDDD